MRADLGELRIGDHLLRVFQVEAVTPGKEGDFDLDFAAGSTLPEHLRGWIGLESGIGSRKVRFLKETATRMHGHPEVPDPLQEGARLWLEIDGVGKASVEFKP